MIELFFVSDDPFHRSRFARRKPHTYQGVQTFIMTVEDVIVQKLLRLSKSGKRKHREDLEGILRVQAKTVDWAYVHHWTDQLGTRPLLDEIRDDVERTRPADDDV